MLKLDDQYKKPTVSERPFTFVFCALWALKQNVHHHNNGFPYWQGLSDPDFWVFVIQELHIPEVGGTKFTTFVLVNVAKLSHPVLFLFALSSFHWTGHQRGEQTQELRMYLWRKWAKWKGLSTKYYDYEQSVLQCNSNVMTDKLKASLVCEQRKDYQPFLTKLLPVYCSLALWSGWKDRDEDLFKSGRHRTGCLLRMHNFCNSMSFQE